VVADIGHIQVAGSIDGNSTGPTKARRGADPVGIALARGRAGKKLDRAAGRWRIRGRSAASATA